MLFKVILLGQIRWTLGRIDIAVWQCAGSLGPNSIEKKRLKNQLKTRLKYQLRFPTLRKSQKMGSEDMSQNQIGMFFQMIF